MVSRVTFELEEQIASALREEQLRGEYAQAAETFRTKLSEEAAQRFHYLEQPSGIALNFHTCHGGSRSRNCCTVLKEGV